MNKYEFYSTILQEDFPVKYREVIADNDSEQRKEIRELREALARVEADLEKYAGLAADNSLAKVQAQTQLAEAVGLIRETLDEMFFEDYPKLEDFLSRIHRAQAEQQE